jgi:hypothetical protein
MHIPQDGLENPHTEEEKKKVEIIECRANKHLFIFFPLQVFVINEQHNDERR